MSFGGFDTRKREGKICMTCGNPRATIPVQRRNVTFWIHATCQRDNQARADGKPTNPRAAAVAARPKGRRVFRPDPNLPEGFVSMGELGERGGEET